MSSEKRLRIALIISAAILIMGGAFLSLATLIAFVKPLALTLVIFGSIATVFSAINWTMHL